MTGRRVAAAVAALAAVGLCRIAYYHFVSEPLHERAIPAPRIDAQFAGLAALLPREGAVGYVTDEPLPLAPDADGQGAKRRFLQMQYALAPLVLRYGDDRAPVVIAHVADPSRLGEVLRAHALVAVASAGPATAVARPR